MDVKAKFREAIRNRGDTMDAVVKADDRSKREVLEQILELYHRWAKLLVRYMRS